MINPLKKRSNMNINYNSGQQPNLKSFYEFARMNNNEKTNMLVNKGVLIDKDNEKEESVNLYYLNGFFVEETISKKYGIVTDIIPFKHGYRVKTFTDIKPTTVPINRKK